MPAAIAMAGASHRLAASATRSARTASCGRTIASPIRRAASAIVSGSRQAVVAVDPAVQRLECLHRVVVRHDPQPAGGDVRDRDEAVDPGGVGGEQPALAQKGDRIAPVVLATPRRRQRDENRRACRGAELDPGLAGRDPAKEVVLELSPQERGERRLSGDGWSCAGHEQSRRQHGRRSPPGRKAPRPVPPPGRER